MSLLHEPSHVFSYILLLHLQRENSGSVDDERPVISLRSTEIDELSIDRRQIVMNVGLARFCPAFDVNLLTDLPPRHTTALEVVFQ